MAEDIQKPQDGVTTTPDNKEGDSGNGDPLKPFSQEDIDRVAAKTREEERKKAQKLVDEAVAKAIADVERKAQLTAEEREKELKLEQEKKLAEKEHDLILRENKLEGIAQLDELGLPIDFIDFLLHPDKKEMNKRIESFKNKYNDSVAEKVKHQLKGEPPVDPSSKEKEVKKGEPTQPYF